MVKVYERYVQRYPEQWFNFHDFWEEPATEGPKERPVPREAGPGFGEEQGDLRPPRGAAGSGSGR
jgi:hypothetical protein